MGLAPLVPVTLAYLAGVLLVLRAPVSPAAALAAGAVCAGLAWRLRACRRAGWWMLLALWVCLGAARMAQWQRHPDHRLRETLPEAPVFVQVHGVVLDDPAQVLRSASSQTCVLALRHVEEREQWVPRAGRLRLTLEDPRTALHAGDEVLAEGVWRRVAGPGNPGEYDARGALARQRVHGRLRVRRSDGLLVRRAGQGPWWTRAAAHLRRRWRAALSACPASAQRLLRPLILGEGAGSMPETLQRAFIETGTMHMVVISGSHVGVVACLLIALLRACGISWWCEPPLAAAGLAWYGVMTGWQPPVARAVIMAVLLLGGRWMDRLLSWPNAVAAAALLVLWMHPADVADPGCQLSFGAVISLLLFARRWQETLAHRLEWMRPRWLRAFLAAGCAATAAVWAGLLPVLVWYFHLITPAAVAANLCLIPLMSLLIFTGTAVAMLGSVWPAAAAWSAPGLAGLVRLTEAAVLWCGRIPLGPWRVPALSPWWGAVYYALIAATCVRHRLRLSDGRLLVGWVAAAVVAIWCAVARQVWDGWHLRVDVLDVGHGDSILVRAEGRAMLIDAGSEEAGRFRVIPFLRHEGIGRLDALILTHPDADHLGGAAAVLEAVRVAQVLTNGANDDTMAFRRMRRTILRQRVPWARICRGLRLLDGAAAMDVLHPPPNGVPGVPAGSNDNSVVVRVTKGSTSLLLTGDIEERGLAVLNRVPWLAADVLKVPHHGSRLGAPGAEFFQRARPRMAVISVGQLHGLPAAQTLRALESVGAEILTTRRDGAIRLESDGRRWRVRVVHRSERESE